MRGPGTTEPKPHWFGLVCLVFSVIFSFFESQIRAWQLRIFIHLQVGVKGACKNFNRGLDCDVLVAEVCEELSNAKILTSRISSLGISQC